MPFWPKGFGESLGDETLTCYPLVQDAPRYYVNSATGSDSYDGHGPELPMATLAHAVSVANVDGSAGQFIILMDGHTETITATINCTPNGINIVGAGSSGGIPTVTLTGNAAAANYIKLSGNSGRIGNIKFATNLQNNSLAIVDMASNGCIVSGCYFTLTSTDVYAGVRFSASSDYSRVEDCTFISGATSIATRPTAGVRIASGASISGPVVTDCVFDGGTNGFTTYGFYDQGTMSPFRIMRLSMLRGADVHLSDTTGGGYINAGTASSSAYIDWSNGG